MAFTDLVYAEFDSNSQTLVSDIVTQLIASPSWSCVRGGSGETALVAITVATTVGGTILTGTAGSWTAAGIAVGTIVRIGAWGAADMEFRTVTAVTSTTITISPALTYTHAIGVNVYLGNTVLKATTTRGADMIVDLTFGSFNVTTNGLTMAVYRSYSGSGLGTPTDVSTRWIFWRSGAGTAASPIHVILSASKDHLFLQTEGARENETSPDSATLGSAKNYFFMDDIVPYYTTPYDTVAAVFAGGQLSGGLAAIATLSMYGHQSRNPLNTSSWEQSKLATLANPDNGLALSQHVQRNAPDGTFTVFPYVVFGDYTGQRGRLAHFWFAGFVNPDLIDPLIGAPPINSKQTIGGDTYKLLLMNKTGTAVNCWSQFGGLSNPSNSVNNIVVAVPST